MEVRFSMLRGSTGFYVSPIWSHRNTDSVLSMGETRDNIYAGSIFNWMSVDATRNRLMEVSGGSAIAVQGAPQEVSLWTNGIYQGMYEDKYKYTCDFGEIRVWGWSSIGAGGKNVGLWNVSASVEYYNGGPMKRELFEHIGTTILNVTHGSHYGGGTDSTWAANEPWTHVYGPYFIYCNNISNTITATNTAAQTLYVDALAQGAAEQTAWPYSWFTNVSGYAQASSRGLVTGQIIINDAYNPNAAESNLWVGLVQQPLTSNGSYDFQDWVSLTSSGRRLMGTGVSSFPTS
jgi:rhamnogalacturonan endolyase